MQDLNGKTALVTGIINKRSIAYAVAERLAQLGAVLAVTYLPMEKDRARDKIEALTRDLSPDLLLPLDVTDPASVQELFATLQARWGRLDVLVHSIANSKREELSGRYSDISLDGYQLAQQVSAYSLIELVRHARPLMEEHGGSVITMSYIGAQRASLHYNVMGAAKASLEANVRYLAMELGAEGIRVNAVSAGPLRTLSASGIKDFLDIMHNAAEKAPLKRNVTAGEVANTVTFLASSLSSGITGQTIFVDGGYNVYG